MRLYLVLLPLLLLGQSNLWSWQTSKKMTREDIKVQIAQKRQTLMTLLEERGLETVNALTTTQQDTLLQIDELLGIAAAPTDIGKKAFIVYIQDWIKDFEEVLSNDDDEAIILLVKDVRRSLRGKIQNTDFPISKTIWRAFDKELKALGKKTDPQALREGLLRGLATFSEEMNTEDKLKEHFKKRENKQEYKAISKKELDQQIMTSRQFEEWLLTFSNSAEDENKEDLDDFNIAYANWLKEEKILLSGVVSDDRGTDSTNNMSKAKFMAILLGQSDDWNSAQPELSQELSQRIIGHLKGDSLAVKDYVNAMTKAITGLSTSRNVIAKNWNKWRRFPTLAGVITILTTENEGSSQYDIVEEYIQWFAQVGGVVDSLKLPSKRQFVTGKVLEELEQALQLPELLVFIPELKSNFMASNKKYLSVEETALLWRTSIGNLLKVPNKLIANYQNVADTSKLIDSLDEILIANAGVDTLQQLFKRALRPLPKPAQLSKGEFVDLTIYLNDGTMLKSRLMTTIDRTEHKGAKVPFAYPSKLQLDVTQGKSPYKFINKPVFDQSPVVRNKQLVTVDFEYTLTFSRNRGSAEVGGGSSSDHSTSHSMDVTVEEGQTTGTETTNSTGTNTNLNTSGTVGGSVTGEGSFFGLFGASVEAYGEVTVGGGVEWTSEHAVNDINTTTNNTSLSEGVSTTVGGSNSTSWNNTIEYGEDIGYITVKGVLTSDDINEETMTLTIDKNTINITSPNLKGLSVNKVESTVGKSVRWKK